jgi:tRNA (mo5U34)-methyltransferase
MSSTDQPSHSPSSPNAPLNSRLYQVGDDVLNEVLRLKPWHMNIQLTEGFSTGTPFSETGELTAKENEGVGLLDLKRHFYLPIDKLYPNGLAGKKLLDCACNAGGYCFWAKERGADETLGFDVRPHWIEQARVVQKHRTVASTANMKFEIADLYDIPKMNLPQYDITMFKGLFYHLPQPVLGLKLAADLTKELLWFNSAYSLEMPDGALHMVYESSETLMSGVHRLSFFPTGPQVIAGILRWLGFKDVRLMFAKPKPGNPKRGRLEILAAREEGFLKPIYHRTRKLTGKVNPNRKPKPSANADATGSTAETSAPTVIADGEKKLLN